MQHKEIFKDFHNKRTRTFAEGILYFSKGINEDYENDKNSFYKKVDEFILQFEKENNTKVLNYQIHTDEIENKSDLNIPEEEVGNIHIHFIFENYNHDNGKSLNFTRSKNGSTLQDLAGNHFSNYGKGYHRGEKTSRYKKYLTPREFAEHQETKKRLEMAQKELSHTNTLLNQQKDDNEQLRADNDNLLRVRESLDNDLTILAEQFDELIEDFEDFLLTEKEKDKLIKLKELFGRYSRNENKEKLLSTIDKIKRVKKAIKKRNLAPI